MISLTKVFVLLCIVTPEHRLFKLNLNKVSKVCSSLCGISMKDFQSSKMSTFSWSPPIIDSSIKSTVWSVSLMRTRCHNKIYNSTLWQGHKIHKNMTARNHQHSSTPTSTNTNHHHRPMYFLAVTYLCTTFTTPFPISFTVRALLQISNCWLFSELIWQTSSMKSVNGWSDKLISASLCGCFSGVWE